MGMYFKGEIKLCESTPSHIYVWKELEFPDNLIYHSLSSSLTPNNLPFYLDCCFLPSIPPTSPKLHHS